MGSRVMKTVGEIVRLSVDYVRKKQGRPRREVEEWIAHCLGLRRLDLYLMFDRPVEDAELAAIRSGMARLGAGEPLAYLMGTTFFYGLEFEVSPDVLIPRVDTEILVDVVRSCIASREQPGTIFDVCTGSGCIGLALKTLFPRWHVVLSDSSEQALVIAKNNARRLGVDVELLHGDLLEPFSGRSAEIIVANPPYLSSAEWFALDRSVQSYEPRGALEAGPNGIELYQRLFGDVPKYLCANGLCAVEIGASQGAEVLAMASSFATGDPLVWEGCVPPAAGVVPHSKVRLYQDFAGRDRVVLFSVA